ncbi:MAG TPA: hypothetical protein VFO55_08850 [Gemmatimonadaceae bacterium]|nr:hypothetical protein [Gemmatimonadaceae bacterium]
MPGAKSTGRERWSTSVSWLNIAGASFLVLIVAGYVWSFANRDFLSTGSASGEVSVLGTIAAAITHKNAPTTAYLTNATLDALTERMLASQMGKSGRVRASFQTSGGIRPDSLPPGAELRYASGGDTAAAPRGAGVWKVLISMGKALQPVTDFSVITMLPFEAKKSGRIGTYLIGSWPSERGAVGPKKAPADRYANPSGFIEVTLENRDTPVSEHFTLGDFLTKGQQNVWPKYLVLSPRLVDKLELVLKDLQDQGIETEGVFVMSGFRTPSYNSGGGETSGRADLSRHMYGDASDIWIDNDRNGTMDDLNKDGRVDIGDARFILESVERVERANPELIGGTGVYRAASGHGPFIHIDTRGYRARW